MIKREGGSFCSHSTTVSSFAAFAMPSEEFATFFKIVICLVHPPIIHFYCVLRVCVPALGGLTNWLDFAPIYQVRCVRDESDGTARGARRRGARPKAAA